MMRDTVLTPCPVIPAKAGTQLSIFSAAERGWAPAFAGVTKVGGGHD